MFQFLFQLLPLAFNSTSVCRLLVIYVVVLVDFSEHVLFVLSYEQSIGDAYNAARSYAANRVVHKVRGTEARQDELVARLEPRVIAVAELELDVPRVFQFDEHVVLLGDDLLVDVSQTVAILVVDPFFLYFCLSM